MVTMKPGPGRKASLFDDEDENDAPSAAGKPFAGEALKVNQEYAKRLAHNKQREAQHRLQELQKQGVVDSDDSSDGESSDDGYIPARTEVKIFDTLAKIRKKDPSIYSEDVKFFDDEDEEDDDEDNEDGVATKSAAGSSSAKKQKPVYLKDAIAQQLIEDGSDLDEDKPKKMKKQHIVTYAEEQDKLKQEFLSTVKLEDEEEDDGFLKLRKKDNSKAQDDVKEVKGDDKEIVQRLEEYFGRDDKLDENEKFLKEYLLNKSWVDEDADKIPSYEEIVGDVIEDEEELLKQDKFEADFNFRFEEGTGSRVMGHSRVVEDSVRRKDESRRQKRLQKEKRLSEADFDRREELKRLKNIKKKEIMEKLERIRAVAGAKDADQGLLESLGDEDLEEDFDPDEYDRKMRQAFGEEYYGAEDADESFQGNDMDDIEKPDFDAEDDLLGLPKGWDQPEDKAIGFSAVRQKVKRKKLENEQPDDVESDEEQLENEEQDNEGDNDDDDDDDDDDDEGAEVEGSRTKGVSKRKKKAKISLREKLAFDKELEEYYKLDYEDMVGDLPTRFKYRQVKPNLYGLSTSQILEADDKDLNQYVSLKKMAPYVTEEWKPKWRFQVSQKLRKKKALRKQSTDPQKHESNSKGVDKAEATKAEVNELSAGAEESKKKKKRRKKGLSLSESRLIAYGKIEPSKKRKKS